MRITGIGEILMDVFEAGNATVGGAPFNVAFHAHQLLSASGQGRGDIVSAVGDDPWGKHILSRIDDSSISRDYISVNPTHATGVANVFVGGGEAGFEIAADAAWDYLASSAATDKLAAESNAVAFGSLAQRSPMSGAMIRDFVAKVPGPRLYDVNLRRNTTDGRRGYSTEVIDQGCAVATIVKTNEVELVELSGMLGFQEATGDVEARLWMQMEQLRKQYGLYSVVVTRGAKGAMLLTEDLHVQLEDSKLRSDEINPVGAGDAFSAGLLYGLMQGWPLKVAALNADTLAAWVTGYESATPPLTSAIKEKLQQIADLGSRQV